MPSPVTTRHAVGLLAGERHEVGFAMEMDRWTSGEVTALSRQPGWVQIPHGLPGADVAQLVEHLPSKQDVVSSMLIVRSIHMPS